MIRRKPMPLNVNHEEYNNNNLLDYDPYIIDDDNTLIIGKKWWDSLTPLIRNSITDRLSENFTLGRVDVPHEIKDKKTRDCLHYTNPI
jgi:hypothetical protein